MSILIGIFSGIFSGIGMGGGTILIFLLTTFLNIEQHLAQSTNLIYFIPTAISAIFVNYKNRKIDAEIEDRDFSKNLKYEALLPLINKEIPMKAHAHRADDILTAIRIAKEFNLKLTLDHCTEGHLISDYIKRENLDAIVGPTLSFNGKAETLNKTFKTPKALIDKGIKVAITTDHPVVTIDNLPLCAAMAMKEGITFNEALEAITINPAKIIGIDERVGSLKEGKDGDLVILNGSPFEIATKTIYTIINGEVVYKD